MVIKQGSILLMDLSPKQGHEQSGKRPYLYLSYKGVEKYAHIAVFAPISTTKRRYPLYQELPAVSQTKGVVMLDQLVTIDYHNQSFQYLEQLPDDYMEKILKIVKVVFQKD
ncbi:PemK family protein [Lactobacillus helsingborgensis]|uniref:Type II toxin-antitoxin system PemK/MazF family toxin n=1 Tax=Lactobacillus helsingborgensis TaxID=1218494 RepID=A0AA47B3N2_9LACO|nr:type II toxin-antitoxin system PemK/MazF family toxin [Lactobacillus helsingborgensis]KJY63042.1 PemK family protein [Lactobacillus helsingborgensis]UZX29516.1 type II toxin-antitoxin system PemK/MazF family toxin [Lactobacillus helsingborgensis]